MVGRALAGDLFNKSSHTILNKSATRRPAYKYVQDDDDQLGLRSVKGKVRVSITRPKTRRSVLVVILVHVFRWHCSIQKVLTKKEIEGKDHQIPSPQLIKRQKHAHAVLCIHSEKEK